MTNVTLEVPDIHCGHCKLSIEEAVGEVAGVGHVEVSIEGRSVAVEFDGMDTTREAVIAAIESQGYVVAS